MDRLNLCKRVRRYCDTFHASLGHTVRVTRTTIGGRGNVPEKMGQKTGLRSSVDEDFIVIVAGKDNRHECSTIAFATHQSLPKRASSRHPESGQRLAGYVAYSEVSVSVKKREFSRYQSDQIRADLF
jgi:hypothetical protein